MSTVTVAHDNELVITRLVKAPQQLVWRAFTEPEHLIKWWGPYGFTNTFHEIEVKVGGVWRFIMHGPDGTDYPNRIVFTEISPYNRLRFDHDDDSDTVDNPFAFKTVITFEDQGDTTMVTLTNILSSAAHAEQMRKFGAIEGGNQTLHRLEQYLETMSKNYAQ